MNVELLETRNLLAAPSVTLENHMRILPETTDTTSRIKVADIVVTDDGVGTNNLSLDGLHAEQFEIDGMELYLKAGTNLNFESEPLLYVFVQVDDPAEGTTFDDSELLIIFVADVYEPPTITVSNVTSTLPENINTANRVFVEEFSITYDDEGPHVNHFTLSGADAGLFEIIGNKIYLIANADLDASANPSLDLYLEIVGSGPEAVFDLSMRVTDPTANPLPELPQSFLGVRSNTGWSGKRFTSDHYTTEPASNLPFFASSIERSFQGDFNGDGIEDVAYMLTSGRLYVGRANSSGRFTISQWTTLRTTDVQSLQVGDFNADGLDDIVGVYMSGTRARLWVFESTGSRFLPDDYGLYGDYAGIESVHVGDFDGVNGDDLAIHNSSRAVWVAQADIAGTSFQFGSPWEMWDPSRTITNISVGDFNNDGSDDLLGVFDVPANAMQRTLMVALSQGTGFATENWGTVTLGDATLDQLFVADFNGDMLVDVAINDGLTMTVGIAEPTNSRFRIESWGAAAGGAVQFAAVGNNNIDGRADILFFDASNRWRSYQSTGSSFNTVTLEEWKTGVSFEQLMVGTFRRPSAFPDFAPFGDESFLELLHQTNG
ncbi:FG-GAP repeat domain-containing protein [Rubinisphaera margarita]|uniref:FG-GAP repeat domain-containing protein n=1 Tax=Rubinisphaera margarita TaxID=2909586 RepID=UPI001EE8FFC0|nr:VCBS repeat-containing protein [Rubinisphaera margarita]MCG6157667.1 VCBS repeat-containing protein [Rubinisphaera margarita]